MRTYGQYCPISRASEIIAERWTPLILRNLFLGASTFNAIAGGVPGMSRSLLSRRLSELQDAGVLCASAKLGGRGSTYELTEAGRALWGVMQAMSDWGRRFIELRPEHTDPAFVLWAWCHVHLRRELLPARRVTVRFDFPDQRPPHHRFWIVFDHGEAELCYTQPAFDEDLQVSARSEPFTLWHVGKLAWSEALKRGHIRVEGSRTLSRALPTWNGGEAA